MMIRTARILLAGLLLSLALCGCQKEVQLINWTDEAIREKYGVSAAEFVPSRPQPMTYIVTCNPVIDPLTGEESAGGRSQNHRTLPASTQDVLNKVYDFGSLNLTLTDNPNRATYRITIDFVYRRAVDFDYRTEDTRIPQYYGDLTVTIRNMVTGESAQSGKECAVFYENSIPKSTLDEGIGKQFFAGPIQLSFEEWAPLRRFLGLD